MIAATDVADLLVRRGMAFRDAHGVVAALVRTAVDSGRALSELSAEELSAHSELLGSAEAAADYYKCSRASPGLSRRSPRAAPRCPACASSWSWRHAALADEPRS